MAKQIARLLKTDIMADLDMPALAQVLASKGRKGDTMLAHITPQEAALLKARGGAGTMNPDTGLPEFYDGSFRISDYADFDAPDVSTGGYRTRQPINIAEESARFAPVDMAEQSFVNRPATNFTPAPISVEQDYGDINRSLGFVPRTISPPAPAPIPGYEAGGAIDFGFGSPETFQYGQPTAPGLAPTQPEPSFLRRTADYLQRPETLERLGLAGLQALPGILQAREARKQGQLAKEEMQRLGAPYQQQGQALIQQAQRGELTAPAQQQIQALQARAAQGVAGRGGVGAEQSAAQVEAFRQQLLQGQYDMGLKVANIGDQIAAGAIRTGLSADQYVNELTNNYFSNMARTLYGTPQTPQTGQTNPPR